MKGFIQMLVRLWLFTARSGNYPEGGTYDTSVLNDETGNCSDSHQEISFENLMNYANSRGESLQRVSSAQEAFNLCSRIRSRSQATVAAPPAPYTGSFSGGTLEHAIYRPTSGGLCGCHCTGGGQKTEPPEQIYQPNAPPVMRVETVQGNANRIISVSRNKPFGTISY